MFIGPMQMGIKDRLGNVVERFYADYGHVVGGWAISLLMIAGGATWISFFLWEGFVPPGRIPNSSPGKALLGSTFGLFVLAGGIGVFIYARWLSGHWVELCEGGIRVTHRGVSTNYPWREIRGVVELIIRDRHRLFDSELVALHTESELHNGSGGCITNQMK